MGTGVSLLRIAAVFLILLSLFTSLPGTALSPDTAEARGPWQGALHRGHPYVQAAAEVQKKFTWGLMADRDIVGTAIGADANGLPVMRVYTKRHGIAGIPDRLESLPVEVQMTGMIVALGNTTARYRPAPIGVSTGHIAITAGTIGARVKDASGNVYALSNNHVYANSNNASLGDPVLQPGTYDGGKDPADRLGTLYAYVPLDFSFAGHNYVDAAIALSTPADLGNATLSDGYGVPGTASQEAAIGMPVKKYGRTTSLTHGTVAEINVTVQVCYMTFYNFCLQSAYFFDQLAISPGTFSAGGDSGSLIVTDDSTNSPVGLLFAGGTDRTFANRIALVLGALGVTIDGAASGNAPPTADFAATTSNLTATFADRSTDSDGTVIAWSWNFGDGQSSSERNPVHTYSAAGTYTVTLTVTDDAGATGTKSSQVTVTDPNKAVHIGDLDGSRTKSILSWKATVTATVHNQNEAPASGATVSGTWSVGTSGSCKTAKNGTCTITRDRIASSVSSVTFTVTGVSLSGYSYSPGANHDPDGSSNGTVITITKP
jgi:PKD repeat protein